MGHDVAVGIDDWEGSTEFHSHKVNHEDDKIMNKLGVWIFCLIHPYRKGYETPQLGPQIEYSKPLNRKALPFNVLSVNFTPIGVGQSMRLGIWLRISYAQSHGATNS